MVGRPREFDPEVVLNAAMEAFWAKGYEATSLADLMEATGLHKGSLYQAFGDKHALFVQALKKYLADMRRMKNDLLAKASSPLDGIRAVTHGMLDMADDDGICPKGCLAINSLVELAPHDPQVQEILADHVQRMRSGFIGAVRMGQKAGQIRNDRSAEEITSLMMTFILGLGANLRGYLGKGDAHKLLDAQIEAIM